MLASNNESKSFTASHIDKLVEPQRLNTDGFECFSVKFEPELYGAKRLICGTCRNFGMNGQGRLFLFHSQAIDQRPTWLKSSLFFDVSDGIYGISWSHARPNLAMAALSNGQVALFDTSMPHAPPQKYNWHDKEVSSIDCSQKNPSKFLSSSYDGTIQVGVLTSEHGSPTKCIRLGGHSGIVYEAKWSPREAYAILSAGADRTVRLWDERDSRSGAVKSLSAHDNEVLSVDWNPQNGLEFVSGSSDQTVKVWDFRQLYRPMTILRGHQRAVRRVRWSPSIGRARIYSVGYDMTLRVWDANDAINPIRGTWDGHTEFVMDLDINPRTGEVATCAWDQSIYLLRPPHWGEPLYPQTG